MKIDALEVTLFAWDDIPPTKYSQGAQNSSGKSTLGLLRLKTDAGIEGQAFLGAATNPADADAARRLRPPPRVGRPPPPSSTRSGWARTRGRARRCMRPCARASVCAGCAPSAP